MKNRKQPPKIQRRTPRQGTKTISGRSLTGPCADLIAKVAQARNQAPNAVIVDVLEGWARRLERKRRRVPRKKKRS